MIMASKKNIIFSIDNGGSSGSAVGVIIIVDGDDDGNGDTIKINRDEY